LGWPDSQGTSVQYQINFPHARRWWSSAKTIPRGMEIAEKFGLEFLPPPGA
jgi:hypothetical protein